MFVFGVCLYVCMYLVYLYIWLATTYGCDLIYVYGIPVLCVFYVMQPSALASSNECLLVRTLNELVSFVF